MRQVILISNTRTTLERVITPSLTKRVKEFRPQSTFLPHVKNVSVNKLVKVEANQVNFLKLKGLLEDVAEKGTVQDLQLLAHNFLQMVAYMEPREYDAPVILKYLRDILDNPKASLTIETEEEATAQLADFIQALEKRLSFLIAHYYDFNTAIENTFMV